MSLYQQFETDKDMEKSGVILSYGAAKICIARAGGSNRRFINELARQMKPYRKQLENGTLEDGVAEQVMREVYADTIILGWDGVTDRAGNLLSYTRENCIKVLTDLPDLFRDIQEQAARAANFRREEMEEQAKNSESSLGGKSPMPMSLEQQHDMQS